MPKLRVAAGSKRKEQVLEFEGDAEVTIGRDPECDVQIGDPKASRVHAKVVADDVGYVLRDLGSSNGTWTEDGRIEELDLRHGSVFSIGSTRIRFEQDVLEEDEGLDSGDDSWATSQITGLERAETLLAPHDGDEDEELVRINHYLAVLHQVVLRCHEARSRDELFEVLDDVAADALEGDRCAVFLPTPEGWALWPPHERRLRARFGVTPFAGPLLNQARIRREPLLCTDKGDLDPSLSMVQAGLRSAMVAPLRIGDDLHALLYVDRLDSDRAFSREDLEFLAAIANQLAVRMHNFSQVAELEAEVERLRKDQSTIAIDLIGTDPGLDGVRSFIVKAAGTGKELVSKALHQCSKRADKPIQVINCAALAENLVESTLFGHIKGAFTGAEDNRPGLFELAHEGTLFLDEIGELPHSAQAKLLRALEQGEVQRLGENLVRKVDVRVLAATNRDLEEEIKKGNFREDLYHRLNVLTVDLPPLRERPGDIETLVQHFLTDCAKRMDVPVKKLTPEARALIMRYSWPGNVRQLRNVIERASIMATGKAIDADDLPETLHESEATTVKTPIVSLAEVEKMHILRVLDHCGGNKKASAELLGIDRSTLYAKLRQYEKM